MIESLAFHPSGFRVSDHRKAIPIKVKFEATVGQNGRCPKCTEKLGDWEETDFDHNPALTLRPWDEVAQDFIPPQLDPQFIEASHKDCHKIKTFGRGGEKRITTRGSDIGERKRVRDLTNSEREFRARLLAKDAGEEAPAPKRGKDKIANAKRPWPKRPFPKAAKRKIA